MGGAEHAVLGCTLACSRCNKRALLVAHTRTPYVQRRPPPQRRARARSLALPAALLRGVGRAALGAAGRRGPQRAAGRQAAVARDAALGDRLGALQRVRAARSLAADSRLQPAWLACCQPVLSCRPPPALCPPCLRRQVDAAAGLRGGRAEGQAGGRGAGCGGTGAWSHLGLLRAGSVQGLSTLPLAPPIAGRLA